MKEQNHHSVLTFILFGIIFILFTTISCVFDTSGLPVSGDIYWCKTLVSVCKIEYVPLKVTVPHHPPLAPLKCYQVAQALQPSFTKGGLMPGENAYCDKNWAIWSVPFKLMGSAFVFTRYSDRLVTGANFLKVRYDNDVEGIYVAYDSRVLEKDIPQWLKRDYTIEKGIYVEVMHGKDKIAMQVYKRNSAPPKNNDVLIQGNFCGYSGFPSYFSKDKLAMYIPIIKPKTTKNSGKCRAGDPVYHQGCYSGVNVAIDSAKKAAVDSLNRRIKFYDDFFIMGGTTCEKLTSCTDPVDISSSTGSLTASPHLLSHMSEISFEPKVSIADISIENQNFKRGVSGSLFFRYKLDNNSVLDEMYLQMMSLKVEDIKGTKAGDFTDIKIVLLKSTKAFCNDTLAWPTYPCKEYFIPIREFSCSESMKHNGKPLLYITENIDSVKIYVDNVAKMLYFSGKLRSHIIVNNKKKVLNIEVNIAGKFKNFAPKARGDLESTQWVECLDNMNKDPVILDAAGSFDVFGTLPTTSFEWFKDYRLPSEISYGKKKKVVLPQNSLSFGSHNFTLVVEDQFGLVDTDMIQVQVQDTKPPSLIIPADLIRFVFPPETCPVTFSSLGQAKGSDDCSGEVMISNNAPPILSFPEGETLIIWEADDGRGNVKKKVQKIIVVQFEIPSIFSIRHISPYIIEALEKAKSSIVEWRDLSEADIDFQPTFQVLEQLIGVTEQMELQPAQEEHRWPIFEKLQAAIVQLNDANLLFRNSNTVEGDERMEMRHLSMERLGVVQGLLEEIMGIPVEE